MYVDETNRFVEPALRALKKADPFSLEALIAWLEKQPGETTYCLQSLGGCLWAQYTKDNRGTLSYSPVAEYRIGTHRLGMNLDGLNSWQMDIAACTPRSFSAALARARALLQASEAGGSSSSLQTNRGGE